MLCLPLKGWAHQCRCRRPGLFCGIMREKRAQRIATGCCCNCLLFCAIHKWTRHSTFEWGTKSIVWCAVKKWKKHNALRRGAKNRFLVCTILKWRTHNALRRGAFKLVFFVLFCIIPKWRMHSALWWGPINYCLFVLYSPRMKNAQCIPMGCKKHNSKKPYCLLYKPKVGNAQRIATGC